MSYPGGGGGYPGGGGGGGGGSYNYGSQYMMPGSGYHHETVPPSQMSPYGSSGLQVVGGQSSPYSGEQVFNNKTSPFQQSFQRPYSPTAGFQYGSPTGMRHPQVAGGHLHMDTMAVDLKSTSIYPGPGFQNSSPYGYNGFGHSPHHQTSSYNSPDPMKPSDAFGDNLPRRHFENFSSGDSDSPNAVESSKPSVSDNIDADKNVADDLSVRRNNVDDIDDNETSRNGRNDAGDDTTDIKKELIMDNLDTMPFIPDIPDLKSEDNKDNHARHPGSDPASPMRSRGLKRSHSPSIDAQDSESQDSYGGGGPVPGQPNLGGSHPDTEFNPGLNEGGKNLIQKYLQ